MRDHDKNSLAPRQSGHTIPGREIICVYRMEDFFSPIPGAITIRESLPRPNWDVIAAWVDNHLQEAMLDETWTQIARDWLSRLSHSLRNSYALHESSNFLILAANARLAERVLQNSERARHTILDTLAGAALAQRGCDTSDGRRCPEIVPIHGRSRNTSSASKLLEWRYHPLVLVGGVVLLSG